MPINTSRSEGAYVMQSLSFHLPSAVHLALPKDFAENCPEDGACILDEHYREGLLIRLDDLSIEFIAANGGVAWERQLIQGFHVNPDWRITGHRFCAIGIDVPMGS